MYDIDGLRKALRAKEIHLHRPTERRPTDVSQIGVAFDMDSYMAQRRNVFAIIRRRLVSASFHVLRRWLVSDTENTKITDNIVGGVQDNSITRFCSL